MKQFQVVIVGLFALSLSLWASGCSSDSSSFSYHYTETVNGVSCDTGAHDFSSKGDYCAGLQNNSLNNNCAADQRATAYSQNCP